VHENASGKCPVIQFIEAPRSHWWKDPKRLTECVLFASPILSITSGSNQLTAWTPLAYNWFSHVLWMFEQLLANFLKFGFCLRISNIFVISITFLRPDLVINSINTDRRRSVVSPNERRIVVVEFIDVEFIDLWLLCAIPAISNWFLWTLFGPFP
jgi:hypothetical protein